MIAKEVDDERRRETTALNTLIFETADFYPHPTVGRPGGRPTSSPVDRSVARVPNKELGTYSQGLRSTGRSTAFFYQSTGRPTGRPTESWPLTVRDCGRPVDRPPSEPVHVVHVGRPGQSTDQPVFCCCCYFLLLSPLPFVIDFPWQSRQFLGNMLLSPTILHLGEDFQI